MNLVVNLALHKNTGFGRTTLAGKKNNNKHSASQVTVLQLPGWWDPTAMLLETPRSRPAPCTHIRAEGCLWCYPPTSGNLTFCEQQMWQCSLPGESGKGLGCRVWVPAQVGVSLMGKRPPRAVLGVRLKRGHQGKLRGVKEWPSRNIRSLERVPLGREMICPTQLQCINSQSKES